MRTIQYIPLVIKAKILFSSKLIFTGLFILGIPSIILISFFPNIDFDDYKYKSNQITETKGILRSVSETNNSVNEKRVLEYIYEFYKESDLIKGKSYGVEYNHSKGDSVDIVFVTSDYSISRIKGTKNGAFEIHTLIFLLGFIIIGLYILLITVYHKINFIKILKNGFEILPTELELEIKSPKLSMRKSDPFYRLKFTYNVAGYDYKKIIYTSADEFTIRRIRMSSVIVDSFKNSRGYIFETLPLDIRNIIIDYSTIANND